MAKLHVSTEFLLQALFPDHDGLAVDGMQFDQQRGIVVLELSGHCIPSSEEIVAEISVARRTTNFLPARRA